MSGRLGPRTDDGTDPRLAEVYAKAAGLAGGLPEMYRVLGHAPEVLSGWLDLAWSLRADAAADRGLRELAILRVSALMGSDYVWRSHWRPALRAGVPEGVLQAMRDGGTPADLTLLQRSVLALTDDLVADADVADTTWAEFVSLVDPREAVELLMTVSWYCCAARMALALRVPLEDHHHAVPGLTRTRA
ncbi:alkylhydroperoxidase family enzyme [Actinocorallia herbida]|uniref:Alkylhydroperoxidase family enzyme n=1 Tax=Actinocorallia herbida TaxID=58109 RepID=A0A3N1D3A2_9ACTN|nr:carboxymuconolactone decarboxylase family protein [Actinocorallia herbida]ROO88017.1 alkylhydroperoxidase family enzyme [Actinocorallia herbida]